MKTQNEFNINQIPVTTTQANYCHQKVIVWSPIIAGALVAFGLTFLLQIFDKGLGIQIFRSVTPGETEAMAWGSFVVGVIAIVSTMYFSGWVAGHLARYHLNDSFFARYAFTRYYGLLYGLLTWCLGLIIGLVFTMHMGPVPQYDDYHAYRNPLNPVLSVVGNTTNQVAIEITKDVPKTNSNPVEHHLPTMRQSWIVLFLTFVLFFLGAAASCFGGYCGLKPYRENDVVLGRINSPKI